MRRVKSLSLALSHLRAIIAVISPGRFIPFGHTNFSEPNER